MLTYFENALIFNATLKDKSYLKIEIFNQKTTLFASCTSAIWQLQGCVRIL